MNAERIQELEIAPGDKKRRQGSQVVIFAGILLITAAAAYLAWPRATDSERSRGESGGKGAGAVPASSSNSPGQASTGSGAPVATNASRSENSILTANGYIINRERIELSPRFMGTVSWIAVKKGDPVTNGQVVVRLDDSEYRARLHQAEGQLATAKVNVEKAQLDYDRVVQLNKTQIETKKMEDDARLQLDAAKAAIKEIEGSVELAQAYLDWTVIRSPIDGVVLEKLVEPNELVVPQSFGGTRGPSTALIAVADPKDLQVEVDLNEADLAKVFMGQKCKIGPEAYPDKIYEGHVAEIAPEANREKGTLQVKVQVHEPDHFLTPNLSAKVDFQKK